MGSRWRCRSHSKKRARRYLRQTRGLASARGGAARARALDPAGAPGVVVSAALRCAVRRRIARRAHRSGRPSPSDREVGPRAIAQAARSPAAGGLPKQVAQEAHRHQGRRRGNGQEADRPCRRSRPCEETGGRPSWSRIGQRRRLRLPAPRVDRVPERPGGPEPDRLRRRHGDRRPAEVAPVGSCDTLPCAPSPPRRHTEPDAVLRFGIVVGADPFAARPLQPELECARPALKVQPPAQRVFPVAAGEPETQLGRRGVRWLHLFGQPGG